MTRLSKKVAEAWAYSQIATLAEGDIEDYMSDMRDLSDHQVDQLNEALQKVFDMLHARAAKLDPDDRRFEIG